MMNSLSTKVFIVMILGFGVRLFFSCTPNNYLPSKMEYNVAAISGIDNSDRFMRINSNIDTMYTDAVAIKLTLSDSSFHHFASNFNHAIASFSFTSVMANSYEPHFIPSKKAVSIKIKTLHNLDDNIKAGDDISSFMHYTKGNDFELYQNVDLAIAILNGIQSQPNSSIVMVLQKSIQNTKAQFEIEITLDDLSKISCLSNTFTILAQ